MYYKQHLLIAILRIISRHNLTKKVSMRQAAQQNVYVAIALNAVDLFIAERDHALQKTTPNASATKNSSANSSHAAKRIMT